MPTRGRRPPRPRPRPRARPRGRRQAPTPETPVEVPAQTPEANGTRAIQIPRVLTVKELGGRMRLPPVGIIKEVMKMVVMASRNKSIYFETPAISAPDLGSEPQETGAGEPEEAAV